MVLGDIAVLVWKARQLNVDMIYLEADVDEDIYNELPQACRETESQVSIPNKVMYGLVHAGLP